MLAVVESVAAAAAAAAAEADRLADNIFLPKGRHY
jgi:hypothetical protein